MSSILPEISFPLLYSLCLLLNHMRFMSMMWQITGDIFHHCGIFASSSLHNYLVDGCQGMYATSYWIDSFGNPQAFILGKFSIAWNDYLVNVYCLVNL